MALKPYMAAPRPERELEWGVRTPANEWVDVQNRHMLQHEAEQLALVLTRETQRRQFDYETMAELLSEHIDTDDPGVVRALQKVLRDSISYKVTSERYDEQRGRLVARDVELRSVLHGKLDGLLKRTEMFGSTDAVEAQFLDTIYMLLVLSGASVEGSWRRLRDLWIDFGRAVPGPANLPVSARANHAVMRVLMTSFLEGQFEIFFRTETGRGWVTSAG